MSMQIINYDADSWLRRATGLTTGEFIAAGKMAVSEKLERYATDLESRSEFVQERDLLTQKLVRERAPGWAISNSLSGLKADYVAKERERLETKLVKKTDRLQDVANNIRALPLEAKWAVMARRPTDQEAQRAIQKISQTGTAKELNGYLEAYQAVVEGQQRLAQLIVAAGKVDKTKVPAPLLEAANKHLQHNTPESSEALRKAYIETCQANAKAMDLAAQQAHAAAEKRRQEMVDWQRREYERETAQQMSALKQPEPSRGMWQDTLDGLTGKTAARAAERAAQLKALEQDRAERLKDFDRQAQPQKYVPPQELRDLNDFLRQVRPQQAAAKQAQAEAKAQQPAEAQAKPQAEQPAATPSAQAQPQAKAQQPTQQRIEPAEGRSPDHKPGPAKLGQYERQPDGAYKNKHTHQSSFRDDGDSVGFQPDADPAALRMSVKLAQEKGWEGIDVSMTKNREAARAIAVEAAARGMSVKGYALTAQDKLEARDRRERLATIGDVRSMNNEGAAAAKQQQRREHEQHAEPQRMTA